MTQRIIGSIRTTLAACVVLAVAAAPASAQARRPRGFVSVNGGVQTGAGTIGETFTYELYVEEATVNVEYPSAGGTVFDVGLGVRVAGGLGIGAAWSRASSSGDASISARVPHPLFDNRHRDVSGSVGGITRNDSAIHAQLYYDARLSRRVSLRLFGGPSFFSLEQGLVESIDLDESYPYDEVSIRTPIARTASGSATGLHAGADLSWMFSRAAGVGALVRWARGSVDLESDSGRSVPMDAGGVQVGGGLRIVF